MFGCFAGTIDGVCAIPVVHRGHVHRQDEVLLLQGLPRTTLSKSWTTAVIKDILHSGIVECAASSACLTEIPLF